MLVSHETRRVWEKVGTAISELKQVKPQEIILVHHDDADGLCSAAVVKAALEDNVNLFVMKVNLFGMK
jgi:single-stranded DNA-specific DHH superfamily exonuclease